MKLLPKCLDTVSHPVRVRITTMSTTDYSPKIEVITSVQRRCRWSGSEKRRCQVVGGAQHASDLLARSCG